MSYLHGLSLPHFTWNWMANTSHQKRLILWGTFIPQSAFCCYQLLHLGLTLSWDSWIKPAIVTFMMWVLPKRKVCFSLLGLSVKHIQGKRNSRGAYKGFKFHYKSIASSGVLFGAESQWNIFLKVSGSPCQLCLCLVRIALCSLLHVTIPCFSQIRLNHYVSYRSQPWLF